MEQNNIINNSELEMAVQTFAKEQNKENLAKLMALMHTARLLVPAVFPSDMDMSLLENMPQGEPTKIPEGVKLLPAVLRNSDGDGFFPAFTGKEQIPENQKYPAILLLSYVEIRNMIDKSNGQIKAMVVNPFTDNLILNPAFLEATKRAEAEAPKQIKMSIPQFHHVIRLQVERTILPALLATDTASSMEKLAAEPEKFVYALFDKAYEPGSVANPYRVSDFSSMVLDISDTMQYIAIRMPAKNMAKGVCRNIYVAYNPQTGRQAYYVAIQAEGRKISLVEIKGPSEIVDLGDAPGEGEEIRRIMEAFEQ